MGPLSTYFILTFVVSWIFFISGAILSHASNADSNEMLVVRQVLIFLGAITPAFIALGITGRRGQPGESRALLNRIFKWQLPAGWYLFAAGYFVVIKLLVAIIFRVITGDWPVFGGEDWWLMVIAILFSTWVQAGEEIGWRGFALPRMTPKYGLAISTLILGAIWACWHLPLFFVRYADTFRQSFPLYLMQVLAISVAMGWLFWRTRGSLLPVMLMHATINNTKNIVPSLVPGSDNMFAWSNSTVAWLTLALLGISAAFFLYQMRNVRQLPGD